MEIMFLFSKIPLTFLAFITPREYPISTKKKKKKKKPDGIYDLILH